MKKICYILKLIYLEIDILYFSYPEDGTPVSKARDLFE